MKLQPKNTKSILFTIDFTKKIAGVQVPLFALRGKNDLGVGDTAAVAELLQWTAEHGFHALQLLPINETGTNHSPYHLMSAMALEPSTITTHPSWLPELTSNDYQKITSNYDLQNLRKGKVHYATVKKLKKELLSAAWKRFQHRDQRSGRSKLYEVFKKEQHHWLHDYTLYRALLELNENNEDLTTWDQETQTAATAHYWLAELPQKEQLLIEERRDFFSYVQWIAFLQWKKIYALADRLDIGLIGDVAIGVSLGSADIFSSPELFDTENFGGAPPEKVFQADAFTTKWGQNWGIPTYRWEEMSKTNFLWWRHRLRYLKSFFHLLRIDHTLGLFRIYSFPWLPEKNEEFTDLTPEEASQKTGGCLPHFIDYDDDTPEHISHNQYRGKMLLSVFLEEVGKGGLIAEDLGVTPSYVPDVLTQLEIPGFKLPHWIHNQDGSITPGEEYPRISVTTYATHDHEPFLKQWETWQKEARSNSPKASHALKILNDLLIFTKRSDLSPFDDYETKIHHPLIQALYASNAWLAISMITDLFGSRIVFNHPGTLSSENWTERIELPVTAWHQAYPLVTGKRPIVD